MRHSLIIGLTLSTVLGTGCNDEKSKSPATFEDSSWAFCPDIANKHFISDKQSQGLCHPTVPAADCMVQNSIIFSEDGSEAFYHSTDTIQLFKFTCDEGLATLDGKSIIFEKDNSFSWREQKFTPNE